MEIVKVIVGVNILLMTVECKTLRIKFETAFHRDAGIKFTFVSNYFVHNIAQWKQNKIKLFLWQKFNCLDNIFINVFDTLWWNVGKLHLKRMSRTWDDNFKLSR